MEKTQTPFTVKLETSLTSLNVPVTVLNALTTMFRRWESQEFDVLEDTDMTLTEVRRLFVRFGRFISKQGFPSDVTLSEVKSSFGSMVESNETPFTLVQVEVIDHIFVD